MKYIVLIYLSKQNDLLVDVEYFYHFGVSIAIQRGREKKPTRGGPVTQRIHRHHMYGHESPVLMSCWSSANARDLDEGKAQSSRELTPAQRPGRIVSVRAPHRRTRDRRYVMNRVNLVVVK